MPFTPPKPLEPAPEELRGATVLVVDDERVWRVILETDLRMLGYDVVLAEDAAAGLEQVARADPDVAIVDLMLPEPMDGKAFQVELRRRGVSLPIVFFTAYPAVTLERDDPHLIGYMSKAVDRADLYALLPEAIRARRRLRSA